jgi:hypothetical protein
MTGFMQGDRYSLAPRPGRFQANVNRRVLTALLLEPRHQFLMALGVVAENLMGRPSRRAAKPISTTSRVLLLTSIPKNIKRPPVAVSQG